MRTLRPALSRSFCSFVQTVWWTTFWAGLWIGFLKLMLWVNRVHPREGMKADLAPLVLAGAIGIGAIGLLCALRGLLLPHCERYEIGATEITAKTGVFSQTTSNHPILEIADVKITSGPLMRLFGLQDVTVGGLTLRGIRESEELRAFLIER